ncbi:MAG: hypothetical protein Tsb002_04110 [Wenzhouxiangellaceae bacterium]
MKIRESGMPELEQWESYFDIESIFRKFGVGAQLQHVVEFGCGYGTFTLPAAQRIGGRVSAYDIDPRMISITRQRMRQAAIDNIDLHQRDFMLKGTGLADGSADFVMLFNILHGDNPHTLLHEAHRLLKADGRLAIMHWRYDEETPRGPPMNIRPRPRDCRDWAENAGFTINQRHYDLPPYHYGLIARPA